MSSMGGVWIFSGIAQYYPGCNVCNDNRHNRPQKAKLDATGSGDRGDNAKNLT